VYAGIPNGPGAVLCPNSKTRRSKPGWCAIRIATSCAWLLAFPPVARGQAVAGAEPGLGAVVGTAVVDGLGRALTVACGEADGVVVASAVREADAPGTVGEGRASGCGPHALTATMPRARASAP
jgi:hypothetical protein